MTRSEEENEDGDREPEKVEGGKRGRGKRTFPSATDSCIGNTHVGLGVGEVFESKRGQKEERKCAGGGFSLHNGKKHNKRQHKGEFQGSTSGHKAF